MNTLIEPREELMERMRELGAKAKPGGGTVTVLVLDDSAVNRKSLTRLLGHAGHRVMEADNGSEALKLVRSDHPDVVISDVLMPQMDGYEFARQVRADLSISETPIIFYSAGYNEEEARALAQCCGVCYILSKPVKPEEMLRTINTVLSEAASPTELPPTETFERAHRRLLTDKLSEKVAELEAALRESRKKEARLLQTMEEIVHAEHALEEKNKELLQKNQEIQNFYHTVSHELKTPLTSAREFISIVLDGLGGPVAETQKEYLETARESCDRLRICINDLMDATRLETGKLTLEIKRGSLANLIEEMITVLGPMAAQKQIALSSDVEPGLPEIPFDENRLMQVLTNLVNNALKFTPENGRITISATEASAEPGFVKVSVTDTGEGLAPEQFERIFERLYQVPEEDGGSKPGVGLGLYICRELVQSHGGRIWVEKSEKGKGTTFSFLLPKEPRSEAVNVLVVDDDARLREMMRGVLERQGFVVTTAEDGQVAVEKMKQKTPDLVVMDLEMPNLDGPELLQQIRQQSCFLPVIIHTGHPDEAIMTRAMEFCPFTLLAKPCSMKNLVETVRSLLPQAATHRVSQDAHAFQAADDAPGHA